MRKTPIVLSACLLAFAGPLAACGDAAEVSGGPGPTQATTPTTETTTATPTPTPTPTGTVIDVTIRGSELEPNGERFKVKVGEPVTLNIDADRAGELHVHSTPEQQLDYPEGTTTLTLTIQTPGIVEVEDHTAGKVLVSLEVR